MLPTEDDQPVRRAPVPFAMAAVMCAVPVIVVGAWLLLPHSAVTVALLAVIALAAVFIGIWRVMSLRALERPPGRNPVPPHGA